MSERAGLSWCIESAACNAQSWRGLAQYSGGPRAVWRAVEGAREPWCGLLSHAGVVISVITRLSPSLSSSSPERVYVKPLCEWVGPSCQRSRLKVRRHSARHDNPAIIWRMRARPKAIPGVQPAAAPRGRAGCVAAESERLYRDFAELTPYRFQPFVRTFKSWDEYEQWRHARQSLYR